MRVFRMRVFWVMMVMVVIMVVVMPIVIVVMMMVVIMLRFEAAHSGAERVTQFAISHV